MANSIQANFNMCLDYTAEKMKALSSNSTFKAINNALNQQSDSVARFLDNSPILKLFDKHITNPAADLLSKSLVLTVQANVDNATQFLTGLRFKHYGLIATYNVNSLMLVSRLASALLLGATPLSFVSLTASLIAGRILGKAISDKGVFPLTESDLGMKTSDESFFKKATSWARDTANKAVGQITLDQSNRLLGVFRSMPLSRIANEIAS